MVNVNRLKGLIVERQTTQEAVADAIGVDRSTFYRKVKGGGSKFTVSEVSAMVKAIPLTFEEATDIFFNELDA